MADSKLIIHPHRFGGETCDVSIRIRKEMIEAIDRIARETGRTRNEIIVESLEFALDNIEIPDERKKVISNCTVGNYVQFGSYPQRETGTDRTPIEWLVLLRDRQKVLLISRYILDCQAYNKKEESITWNKCSLRNWLNSTFLTTAFTVEEQKRILMTNVDESRSISVDKKEKNTGNSKLDKIFLLSLDEGEDYLPEKEVFCAPTDYAILQGVFTIGRVQVNGRAAGEWWYRSINDNSFCWNNPRNSLLRTIERTSMLGVRPAMWIDLNPGSSADEEYDGLDDEANSDEECEYDEYEDSSELEDEANDDECQYDGDYEYRLLKDGTAIVTEYYGEDTEVIIPATLGGHPISKIGPKLFAEKRDIRSVIIPDSVTTIGESAFALSGLKSVTIPGSVKKLDTAFHYCSELKSVTILSGMCCIGNEAFYKCESLTEVIIPDSVTAIGKQAFYSCRALANITIPDSVTTIGESAFALSGLKSVTIPSSVITIGENAFHYCKEIEIYCDAGSQAERHARKNKLKCVVKRKNSNMITQP